MAEWPSRTSRVETKLLKAHGVWDLATTSWVAAQGYLGLATVGLIFISERSCSRHDSRCCSELLNTWLAHGCLRLNANGHAIDHDDYSDPWHKAAWCWAKQISILCAATSDHSTPHLTMMTCNDHVSGACQMAQCRSHSKQPSRDIFSWQSNRGLSACLFRCFSASKTPCQQRESWNDWISPSCKGGFRVCNQKNADTLLSKEANEASATTATVTVSCFGCFSWTN